MRRFMATLVFLFLTFPIAFYGCATVPTSPPDECADSVLWKIALEGGTTPSSVGILFQFGSLELLKKYEGADVKLQQLLDDLDKLLSVDGVTYVEVALYSADRVKMLQTSYSPELILLMSAFASKMTDSIPVNTCDLELLKEFSSEQRRVLELYRGKL